MGPVSLHLRADLRNRLLGSGYQQSIRENQEINMNMPTPQPRNLVMTKYSLVVTL